MNKKLFIFLVVCSALCAGQTTLTTPTLETGVPQERVPNSGPIRNSVLTGPPTDTPAVTEMPASTKIAGPLTSKSDFQLLAEEAAGRSLQVYGRRLFEEVPTTFAPIDHIAVPSDYVIGP